MGENYIPRLDFRCLRPRRPRRSAIASITIACSFPSGFSLAATGQTRTLALLSKLTPIGGYKCGLERDRTPSDFETEYLFGWRQTFIFFFMQRHKREKPE